MKEPKITIRGDPDIETIDEFIKDVPVFHRAQEDIYLDARALSERHRKEAIE